MPGLLDKALERSPATPGDRSSPRKLISIQIADLKSRKKVEEAKQKEREEETGEYIWRVRGAPGSLKVVRLRKRQ